MSIEIPPVPQEPIVKKFAREAYNLACARLPIEFINSYKRFRYPEVLFDNAVTVGIVGVEAKVLLKDWDDYYLLYGNHNEEIFIEAILRSLGSRDESSCFWDIGAAHGSVIVFAGQLVDSYCCIEPNSRNVSVLETNIALNQLEDKGKVVVGALSNEIGSYNMHFSDARPLEWKFKANKYGSQ